MQVPYRIRKAADRMIAAARAGTLGARDGDGCVYHDTETGRTCGIGSLLSPRAHRLIEEEGVNINTAASSVAGRLESFHGFDFLEETGLTPHEADVFQNIHDNTYSDSYIEPERVGAVFEERIEAYLAGRLTSVGKAVLTSLADLLAEERMAENCS